MRVIFFLFLLSILACHNNRKIEKDVIRVIVSSSPESLDPRTASSEVASNISQLIYASLFRIGDDLLPEPLLADEITQIDPLTFSVHLRSGIYFHDGTPITAHDVAYTYNTIENAADKYAYLKEVVATSEQDIRFSLNEPHAPLYMDLCSPGIVSAKNPSTGSGPFELVDFNRVTETIRLKSFTSWFQGKPPLKGVEIRVVRDATTRLLELIKGKADLSSGNLSPTQVHVIERYPQELTIKRTPGLGYAYLAFNLRKPGPLTNIKVRQALAYALDIDTLVKTKFHGMATRATGMLPPRHWAKSNELPLFRYDPKKAEQLLDEAGYPRKGKHQYRFHLMITTTPDRFRQSLSLIYAAQWKAVGVNAEVRIQDWGSLYQDMKQGNFEVFSAVWIPVAEPDLMYWVFHSSNIPTMEKGGGNRGGYIDPFVDEILEKARSEMDIDKRAHYYQEVEKQLAETLPYIPLWFSDEIVVMNRRVLDFTPSRTGSLFSLTHTRLQR